MVVNPFEHGRAEERVDFRPLYRQVKAILIERIASGTWSPGAALPSEFELAAELSASQGTVRKALDEMAAERLVVRRQGRGTFVARHDDARILFQFFKLVSDEGEPVFPESVVLSIARATASADEVTALKLAPKAEVVRIVRCRSLGGRPAIHEFITLPAALFGALCDGPVPNNLYDLYATRFGVTVARAQERLKAVIADAEIAASLDLSAGTPLLLVDRIALSLAGTPAEWRRSWCRTDDLHYLSDLK